MRYKLYGSRYTIRSGQIMILTVLALGGAILGATTIAGILMLYQIRQTTDLASSGKAIYAADAGIEWTLYNWYCGLDTINKVPCPASSIVFTNNATATIERFCFDSAGNPWSDGPCDDWSTIASSTTFKSIGTYGNTSRAFGLSF